MGPSSPRGTQTAPDLPVDEPTVMVLQNDVQRPALGRRFNRRVSAHHRQDRLHLGGGTRLQEPTYQVVAAGDLFAVQHDPVTNGRVDGLPFAAPRPDLVEDATDARHEQLQRRRLRDDLVAHVTLQHDVVPRVLESVVIDAPYDPDGVSAIAARVHQRHQAVAYGGFDRRSRQRV